MGNRYPHTWKDQLKADRIYQQSWEDRAQQAATEYRDLIGQEAYDEWCNTFVPNMQAMSWNEIYNMLMALITEAQMECECRDLRDGRVDVCPSCKEQASKSEMPF